MDTQQISDTFSTAIAQHGRAALLYSGGVESALLLRLAAPWRSHITVYTGLTGAEFPHMLTYMAGQLEGWDHRTSQADLAASFVELGLPSSVLPIEHAAGISADLSIEERSPRIVPWPLCCKRNRWEPVCDAVKAAGLPVAFHGQRAGDYPASAPAPLSYPGLELVGPLWDVSRAEVFDAIAALGIALPSHYAAYPSSLDCAVCPSSLTTKRRAWMSSHYPEPLAVAEKLHAAISQAVLAALDGDNTKNAFSVR